MTTLSALFATLLLLGCTLLAANAQLTEDEEMQKETYLSKSTTIKTAIIGSVTVGYASKSDYENQKNPASPTITMLRGSSITHSLSAVNKSKILIRGGTVGKKGNVYGGEVQASGQSTVTFSGGTAKMLNASQHSTITLTGGTIGASVTAADGGTVNVKGGTVRGEYIAMARGTLNFLGTNLSKKLAKPGDAAYLPSHADQEDRYVLGGTLSDGTSLNGKILAVTNEKNYKINFVKTPVHFKK